MHYRNRKYPDSGILLNFDDDDYSQGYGQIKQTFKALTKDNILQLYISELDFRSSNDDNDIGYNIYAFDIGYQKSFKSSQPIKIEFKFDVVIPAGIYGYALVLTNKNNFYKQRRATNVRSNLSLIFS